MPRVEMTRSVKVALVVLRIYLIIMLALILVGFLRREKTVAPPDAPAAPVAAATQSVSR